jgi:hypothetical protein
MNQLPDRVLPSFPKGVSAYEAKVVVGRSIAGRLRTTWEVSVTGGMFPPPVPRWGNPPFTRIGNSRTDPQGDRCTLDPSVRAYGLGLIDYLVTDLAALGAAMTEAAQNQAAAAGVARSRAQLTLDSTIYDGGEHPVLWHGTLSLWLPNAEPSRSTGSVFSIDAGIIGTLKPMYISAPVPHQGLHLVTDNLNAIFSADVRSFFRNQLGYLERL